MEELNATRKTAFDRLTNEQQKALGDEIKELNQWYTTSKDNLELQLKRNKKWKEGGLDTNQKYFTDIIKEYRTRFAAIQRKYGIVPMQQKK